MMKQEEQIEEVSRHQQYEKHNKAMNVLCTLQFFVELHELTCALGVGQAQGALGLCVCVCVCGVGVG